MNEFDAIVIGAGAAGLMAATDLARAGLRVIVLEARDRIGGRIFTRHHDVPLELGAEFVHGLPPVTWLLLAEAGIGHRELGGTTYRCADGRIQLGEDEPSAAFDTLEAMSRWHSAQAPGSDLSFQRYLAQAGITGAQAEQARRYVEGFNAADQAKISVAALVRQQAAEDAIQADRLFHLSTGYDALPRYLADAFLKAGGEMRLSHPVESVEWRRGAVTVHGVAAKATAPCSVITLPLGVLKADTVRFEPPVPGLKKLLSYMEMGPVLRVSLLFRRPFWEAMLPEMFFLFSPGSLVPTWWTAHPGAAPQLTGWIGGTSSLACSQNLRGDALVDAVLSQLAVMFNYTGNAVRAELLAAHTHDWLADPWARGAYSYAGVGGVDASTALAANVEQTLYFAGEHTDTEGHWGTVHAALASGQRAAREILNSA